MKSLPERTQFARGPSKRTFHGRLLIPALICSFIPVALSGPLDTWHNRLYSYPGGWADVAYGGGSFVMVGVRSIVTSPNGVDWTTQFEGDGTSTNLYTIAYLNGRFIGSAVEHEKSFIVSSVDGTDWVFTLLPAEFSSDFRGLGFAYGNGVYVGANRDHWGVSTDGTNYIKLPLTNWVNSINFGNGIFLATLQRGFFCSTDGTNWNSCGPELPGGSTIYANGLFYVFSANIYTSADGLNWQTNTVPLPPLQNPAYGGGYFVLNSFDNVAYSTNLLTWTIGPNLGARGPLAYGNGTFVMAGSTIFNEGIIYQSDPVGGMSPHVVQQPSPKNAYAGSKVTFGVGVAGTDPLTFQWRKDGGDLIGQTNTTLTITNVQLADEGAYSVFVTNAFGNATSSEAQLTVSFLDIALYAGINLFGQPGDNFRIDYLENLSTNWQTLTNLTLPSSPYIWIDYGTPQNPQRFYRAVLLE